MKLNKNQKIIIIIALFAMAIVILFPPEIKYSLDFRRSMLRLNKNYNYKAGIDVNKLTLRLLGIAFAGSALIISFSLKKKEKEGDKNE